LTLFAVASAVAQDNAIAEPFLEIRPGISTRTEVNALFGDTKRERYGEYSIDYFLDGKSVGFTFSDGKCERLHQFAKLPEWTVQEVFYSWRNGNEPKLDEVITDRKKFVPQHLGDVADHLYYVNDEAGITVVYDETLKRVLNIELRPSKYLREKYACHERKR